MEVVKAFEVEVGPIHDVERAGVRDEHVQNVDVMQFAVGDVDEGGDVAAQVEERVQLDGAFGPAEPGPWEQRQAEVDRRGVERVDGILGGKTGKRVIDVGVPGNVDEMLREVGVDLPVTGLGWRWRGCCGTPRYGCPCDRACRTGRTGRSRCRAGCSGR